MDAIEAALQKWAKSPEGQKALREAQLSSMHNGSLGARSLNLGGAQLAPSFYQEQFEKVLVNNMVKRGIPASYRDYIYVHDAGFNTGYNKYEFWVYIDGDSLYRPSLEPYNYDGIDNILRLLNTGYHAADYVYGYWDKAGKVVRSKKDRKGLFFLQEAVAEFCAMYEPHATAEIVDDEWNGDHFWEWSL